MIKIAYIVSTLKRCGPTNQLFHLIRFLDRKLFHPIVITLSPEPDDSSKTSFQAAGVAVESLGLSRIQGLFLAGSRVRKLIASHDVDLVHSSGMRADVLSSMGLSNIPRIATLRNYAYNDYPRTYGRITGRLLAALHIRYMRRLELRIGCSQSVVDAYRRREGVEAARIWNGVDVDRFFRVDATAKGRMRSRLSLSAWKRVFVVVGNVIEGKDPETIIRAIEARGRKDEVLVFLGEGHLRQGLQDRFGGENILFVGSVKNVDEYLKASDFFISASLAEGLPNSVMEALACGIPCVLSNIPSHREILELGNGAGWLFRTGDASDLECQLNDLEDADYAQASMAASSIIANHLSAEAMSANYQKKYLEAVGKT